MSSIVVDASMAAAWLMPDEQSLATDSVLRSLSRSSGLVPTLFRHEIRSVPVLAFRRGRISAAKASDLSLSVRGLPLVEIAADDDAHSLSLALGQALTAYDAAYLSLAMRTGSLLATLDRKLAAAARKLAVGVVGPLVP